MSNRELEKRIEEMLRKLKELLDQLGLPGSTTGVMKEKPYSPPNGPGDTPICGVGDQKQLYQEPKTVAAFASAPYAPKELVELTELINQILQFRGAGLIEDEVRRTGQQTLHLTLVFDSSRGFYLSYARHA
jgi:hypothetical protein